LFRHNRIREWFFIWVVLIWNDVIYFTFNRSRSIVSSSFPQFSSTNFGIEFIILSSWNRKLYSVIWNVVTIVIIGGCGKRYDVNSRCRPSIFSGGLFLIVCMKRDRQNNLSKQNI
jgi:hypothetical protein